MFIAEKWFTSYYQCALIVHNTYQENPDGSYLFLLSPFCLCKHVPCAHQTLVDRVSLEIIFQTRYTRYRISLLLD